MTTTLKSRVPALYLERGNLHVKGSAVVFTAKDVDVDVPVDRLATLLLGPGTSVSHAAVKACASSNTLLQWVGEEGASFYGAGDPLTGDPERIKQQVAVAMNPKWRAKALVYMFNRRFGERVASNLDENTIRGMEGARIRAVYARLAREHNVSWGGRRTGSGGDWVTTDSLNQAISVANGHLTQLATVAVVAAGMSPAIGILHSGFNRAYSCDVADLHKFEVTVPLAFRLHAAGMGDMRREVRHAVRDEVARLGLLDKMIRDAVEVVDAGLRRT